MNSLYVNKDDYTEQLRALENDIPIYVVDVDYRGRSVQSVDNPHDIERAEAIIAREGELL